MSANQKAACTVLKRGAGCVCIEDIAPKRLSVRIVLFAAFRKTLTGTNRSNIGIIPSEIRNKMEVT
ncbi:hypothetical protein HMPREF9098_0930 [Kingella denitrificans ATCC 33394]|uniref:Uncharacterized protein n=1 Tax=Kingella denitrificans ATCC 33394 TaxID=888741 RepID=F0EYJ6_9NEIS|nr:hypothetical protein HMPREF9098_0930 [Kingella denitrificans ATCC 33394]